MPPTHRSRAHHSAPHRHDAGPPQTGPEEKDVLVGFLDYLRTSIIAKTLGVPEPQIRTPGVASGTNLLGLVKHLTHVERHWILGEPTTDWAATFRPEPDESADDILRAYQETTARANETIAACPDISAPGRPPGARPGPAPTLRWTLTHMIEETARHAGHADILRELIDGETGR
ncbi:DinB family protein [Streptomonospora sediminis]